MALVSLSFNAVLGLSNSLFNADCPYNIYVSQAFTFRIVCMCLWPVCLSVSRVMTISPYLL
jgi:hypothetical protein